jgi:signal transduction histidine kinase
MAPVHQQSSLKAEQYPFARAGEDNKRILIVDDDELVRSLFETTLSARHPCAVASGFDEALALLSREEFALVISDVIMPGRSGIELLREITTRFPDIAVIMVSGVDRTQRVMDAVRLGAYDYLVKPCELDVLELTVERALERQSLLRTARQHKRDLERWNKELRQGKAKLERLQAQIIHSEKMASLGQLAAGIAHELNNPAGFIYGNMEVLDRCAKGLSRLLAFYESLPLPAEDAAQARALKSEIDYENTLADLLSIICDCREGAVRIRDVVDNLRVFSRLDEAEFKKVDIHEGLESTIRLLSRYYGSGSVALKREYAPLPLVDCYAGQLNQVWMNLLVNAAQAIGDAGEVRVTTAQEGDRATITISDTGCGVNPDHLSKIFDPFFTTKAVGEGTGLGLSVSYGIIERHNGTIRVESRVGQGTAFTVSIPINAVRQGQERTSWTAR